MVSLELQKQHLALHFQFLLIRLSLVSVTPFFKNQRNILIFSGTFIFEDLQNVGVASLVIIFEYMDFTVNKPFLFAGDLQGTYWTRNWARLSKDEEKNSLNECLQRLEVFVMEIFGKAGWNSRNRIQH